MEFEGRVPTQGTQLWVEAVGEGAPVVLLHAGIAHSRMWDSQVAELRSRFNVIRYDVRGFGRSYSPDMEYVDHHDLASVMNHFSISSASLGGASNGGRIAVDFALENPDRIRGLFLIDKEGNVRHQIVNDLPLGRSVDEAIRMVDALQFHEQHGEVCPANWNKGKEGMKPSAEGVASYLKDNATSL